MIDIDRINGIRSLFSQIEEAHKQLNTVLSERITDMSVLSFLYGAMNAAGVSRDAKLFILLYLAAPEALAGKKMRKGVRPTFSILFGYKSGSAISVRSRDLMFRYNTYRKFRKEINDAMRQVESILQGFKHIKDSVATKQQN